VAKQFLLNYLLHIKYSLDAIFVDK